MGKEWEGGLRRTATLEYRVLPHAPHPAVMEAPLVAAREGLLAWTCSSAFAQPPRPRNACYGIIAISTLRMRNLTELRYAPCPTLVHAARWTCRIAVDPRLLGLR